MTVVSKAPTPRALKFVAQHMGVEPMDLFVRPVTGGYSLNRRAVVSANGMYVFVKEVDEALIDGDGQQERAWLAKDQQLSTILQAKGFSAVAAWSRLSDDQNVLLLPAYRPEDGWLWEFPKDEIDGRQYVQAVMDAADALGQVHFSEEEKQRLALSPFFRDKIAEDAELPVLSDPEDRERIVAKCDALIGDSDSRMASNFRALKTFVGDTDQQAAVREIARHLVLQQNDTFGHCDLRPDNVAYHPGRQELILVDWNWASFAPEGFAATEFLTSVARRGLDVSGWLGRINEPLLAALIGFFLRGCIKPNLGDDSLLRDHQAMAAAAALRMLTDTSPSVKT